MTRSTVLSITTKEVGGGGGGGGYSSAHKSKKLKIEDFVPKSSVQFIFEIQSLLVTVSGTQLTKVTVRFHT